MKRIRPQHLALIASGGVTCLMVGLLLGIVAAGGHVSRVLDVIHAAPPPATTAPSPHLAPPPQPATATARGRRPHPPGPPWEGGHHHRPHHHDRHRHRPDGDQQS
jgi:hypothetical protein